MSAKCLWVLVRRGIGGTEEVLCEINKLKMKEVTNNPVKKVRIRRPSESKLSSKDELFRDIIRAEISSHPFWTWTESTLREEAQEIAKSLSKNFDQVRKALMNRKNFVERKIMDSCVELNITDPYSPTLQQISEKLQISYCNVFHVTSHNLAKISKKILEKNTAKA